MEQTVLLRMTDITKTFPGVKALDHVSLEVKAGTVHALMGENGAGKSTLMKCLFGIYSKDSGHIYLEGREVNFTSSKEALSNGVAMVHQELNQALKRTVMDNLWLGRYPKIAGFIVDTKCSGTQKRFLKSSASTLTPTGSWARCRFPSVKWWRSQRPSPITRKSSYLMNPRPR